MANLKGPGRKFSLFGSVLFAALMVGGCSPDPSVSIRDMWHDRQTAAESKADYEKRQKEHYVIIPLVREKNKYELDLKWAEYDAENETLNLKITRPVGEKSELTLHALIENDVYIRKSDVFVAANVSSSGDSWQAVVPFPRNQVETEIEELDWMVSYVPAVYKEEIGWGNHTYAQVILNHIKLVNRESQKVYWEKTFPRKETLACAVPTGTFTGKFGRILLEETQVPSEVFASFYVHAPRDISEEPYKRLTLAAVHLDNGIRLISKADDEARKAALPVLDFDCKSGELVRGSDSYRKQTRAKEPATSVKPN